jgi:hypothetical protein
MYAGLLYVDLALTKVVRLLAVIKLAGELEVDIGDCRR